MTFSHDFAKQKILVFMINVSRKELIFQKIKIMEIQLTIKKQSLLPLVVKSKSLSTAFQDFTSIVAPLKHNVDIIVYKNGNDWGKRKINYNFKQ